MMLGEQFYREGAELYFPWEGGGLELWEKNNRALAGGLRDAGIGFGGFAPSKVVDPVVYLADLYASVYLGRDAAGVELYDVRSGTFEGVPKGYTLSKLEEDGPFVDLIGRVCDCNWRSKAMQLFVQCFNSSDEPSFEVKADKFAFVEKVEGKSLGRIEVVWSEDPLRDRFLVQEVVAKALATVGALNFGDRDVNKVARVALKELIVRD